MLLNLLPAGLAGFVAQLIDGALGMGYGVTSASLLLATGMAPAVVSSTVKFAQLGTTVAAGLSHRRVGNVRTGIMLRLAVPGGVGALVGATVLSSLSLSAAAPLMSALLLGLGILVLLRVMRGRVPAGAPRTDGAAPAAPSGRVLVPLGLVGGLVDSTGGGGWGPVVSSSLLASARIAPRHVIGSVAAAEFVVTLCASVGFVLGLGVGGVPIGLVLALMGGGVLAAPLAARLAGRLPAPLIGILVGSAITLLNLGPVLAQLGASLPLRILLLALAALACLVLFARAVSRHRRRSRRESGGTGDRVPALVAADEGAAQDARAPLPSRQGGAS